MSIDSEHVQQVQSPAALAGPRTHLAVRQLFESFPKHGKLLDLGCGEGALSRQLDQAGFDVVASDISPDLFKAHEIPFVQADFTNLLPFADNEFEYLASVEVIEHLEDQFAFIRECHRVLAPGGKLVITTPNVLNMGSRWMYFWSGFYPLFTRPVNEFRRSPEHDHIHPISYIGLRYILQTSGFAVDAVTTDRLRRSDFSLLALWPLFALATWRNLRRETDERQKCSNKDIYKHLTSRAVLQGRTLIVVATKLPE